MTKLGQLANTSLMICAITTANTCVDRIVHNCILIITDVITIFVQIKAGLKNGQVGKKLKIIIALNAFE